MEERKYIVYKHSSPEEKVYVGCISTSPERRWGGNGCRYKFNNTMYDDIQKFEWDK